MPCWNRNSPLWFTGCKCVASNGFVLPSLLQRDGVAAICGKAAPACSNGSFPYALRWVGLPICIQLNAIKTRCSFRAKEAGEVIGCCRPPGRHVLVGGLFRNGGSRRQQSITSGLPPESKLWHEVTAYTVNTKKSQSKKN